MMPGGEGAPQWGTGHRDAVEAPPPAASTNEGRLSPSLLPPRGEPAYLLPRRVGDPSAAPTNGSVQRIHSSTQFDGLRYVLLPEASPHGSAAFPAAAGDSPFVAAAATHGNSFAPASGVTADGQTLPGGCSMAQVRRILTPEDQPLDAILPVQTVRPPYDVATALLSFLDIMPRHSPRSRLHWVPLHS